MVTRPAPASVLSASRTGVLDTPSTSARSVSTSACPGLSSPVKIACLIASSTATVRDGRAPAAPVRNARVAPTAVVPEAAVLVAAVDIMYRISYMTGFEPRPGRLGCQPGRLGCQPAALASEACTPVTPATPVSAGYDPEAALLGRK